MVVRGVALSDSVDLLNIDFNPTDLNFRIVTYIQSQSIFPLRIYKIVGKWQLHIYDRSVDDISISHRALCIQDSRWPRVSLSTSKQLELLRRYDASWRTSSGGNPTLFFLSPGTTLGILVWKCLGTQQRKSRYRFRTAAVSPTRNYHASGGRSICHARL